MYASGIRARARDGIASHGTVGAYIRDFRASSKAPANFIGLQNYRELLADPFIWSNFGQNKGKLIYIFSNKLNLAYKVYDFLSETLKLNQYNTRKR